MAYLGRGIENLSDRVVLDSLTASATADYTLQLNSVNFVPSSAESLTVSLNGVIQKPGSSYTVSSSTLSFSSALTSSDSIDFIIAERGITLQTPSAGSVGTSQLASSAVTNAKIASNAAIATTKLGTGAVLQVKSTTKTDTFTTSSGTFTDITGLSVSITPSSTSSKILVSMNTYVSNSATAYVTQLRLVRDSTAICIGDAASNRTRSTAHIRMGDTYEVGSFSATTLDSPSTTSATTYKVQMLVQTGGGSTGVLNRTGNDSDHDYQGRTASTITAMEIAG